jgi:hypothetical protein
MEYNLSLFKTYKIYEKYNLAEIIRFRVFYFHFFEPLLCIL